MLTVKNIMYFYLILLLFIAILMTFPYFIGPAAVENIAPVAKDAFKTVLGAVIGALSVALAIAPSKEEDRNDKH